MQALQEQTRYVNCLEKNWRVFKKGMKDYVGKMYGVTLKGHMKSEVLWNDKVEQNSRGKK